MVKELIKTACQTRVPRPQRPVIVAQVIAAIAETAEMQESAAAVKWVDSLINVPVKDVVRDVASRRDDFAEWSVASGT